MVTDQPRKNAVRTIVAAMLLLAPANVPSANARVQVAQSSQAQVAMEFLAALGRLEFEKAGSFLDEHAVLDLPYANNGLTVRGRKEILGFFEKTMGKSAAGIEYKLDRAYPNSEAGAVVLEISTQGRTAAGREYTNRLVAIFEFRDGKIVLFREYFNPVPVR